MKKFFRFIYYSAIILLFVFIVLVGYTQTAAFHESLRSYINKNASKVVKGDLSIGAIKGNLFTGIKVCDVTLSELGVDVIHAKELQLKYDPIAFFFQRASFADAKLESITVTLIRSTDGTWNISRLFRSTRKDTTPSSWIVDLKNIRLVNASVSLIDSLALERRIAKGARPPSESEFDYANFRLNSIFLQTSIYVAPQNYKVHIYKFSCSSVLQPFQVQHLEGTFSLRPNELLAQDVNIQLPQSSIGLTASLKNADIFKKHFMLAELKNKPVDLKFSTTPIDMRELKFFLHPYVDFLDSAATIIVKCDGTFDAMRIEECSVISGKTFVNLKGTLLNLHHPSDLELHVFSDKSSLDPSVCRTLLRGLSLPNLDFLGAVTTSLSFDGKPKKFRAIAETRSSLGTIEANTSISLETKPMTYEGVVRVRQGSIGALIGDTTMQSDVNGHITFNGNGTDIRSMTAIVKMELDSSSILQIPVEKFVAVINTAEGTLRSHSVAQIGESHWETSGSVNVGEGSTFYSFAGKVISCNLADFFHSARYGSMLSFQYQFGGAHTHTQGEDSLTISFFPSTYGTRSFNDGAIQVHHSSKEQYNHLAITSKPLKAQFEGSFSPSSLIQLFNKSILLYSSYFSDHLFALDSIRSQAIQFYHRQNKLLKLPTEDVSFNLVVSDLSAIGTILSIPMEGEAKIRGSIKSMPQSLGFDLQVQSPEFGVAPSNTMIAGSKVDVHISASNLSPQSIFDETKSALQIHSQSLRYNNLVGNNFQTAFISDVDTGTFALSCLIDSTVAVKTKSEWWRRNALLDWSIPMLSIALDSTYEIKNAIPVHCIIGRDGVYFQSFTLQHDSTQIMLSGIFDPSGNSNFNGSVEKFSLKDLRNILSRTDPSSSLRQMTGNANAQFSLRGTFDNPMIDAAIKVDSGALRDAFFSTVKGTLSYSQKLVQLAVRMSTTTTSSLEAKPDVELVGSIPYTLKLSSSSSEEPMNGDIYLRLQARDVNAVLLSPFLPFLENINGTFACDLSMVGPVNSPQYGGFASFNNIRFLFRPLGIQYILNGKAVSEGNSIRLNNVSVRNVPEDNRPNGIVQVDGTISMVGLSLSEFSLTANGELLVMKENRRLPGQNYYGTLYAATSPRGIMWEGNAFHSFLKGELYLLDAQLIFPPKREIAAVRASTIKVTFENDTLRAVTNGTKQSKIQQLTMRQEDRWREETPVSFLDNIDYDLTIETQGNTTIRFVFNTQTSEELFAVLQGRVTYNRIATISRFIGKVQVVDRSYYNFFKKFDATGTITFTGELGDPELNVTARYEGIHAKDTTAVTGAQSNLSSSLSSAERERIAVILKITGSLNEPHVSTSLERYENNEWVKYETGDDESNALSFIISGQFTNELTAQQRTSMIGTNLGFGIAAGMITGPLSEALRRNTAGYVQSIDVLYYGGQFNESADVRLTGQVGDAVIRFGGKVINDPFGNANVSVELPISSLSRNLILSLEHIVEGTEYSEEQRRAYNSAKIFYRFTF